jgi:hypothetical protein
MNNTSSTDKSYLEKTIWKTLTEAGISSLDTLVSQLASSSLSRLHHEDYLFMIADSGPESSKPHQPPKMNLLIDGKRHEPSMITEFNGRALYSTPGVDSNGDPVLYSFTTLTSLNDHLRTARHDIGTSNPDSLPELSYYFEHTDGQGDWLQNGPSRAWRDLTRVPRGVLGFGDWNDIISSVDWCRWDISLYEHINYGGSQLYLPAGRTYYHLDQFGWNDRASSVVNWGRRF